MNKTHLLIALLVFLISQLLMASCQDKTDIQRMDCQLLTAAIGFTEDSIQVVYRLEAKGNCSVESFFYYVDNQKIIINKPDTLVEVFTRLHAQRFIQVGATGTSMDGSIKVSFKAVGIDKTYEAMDQCRQQIIVKSED